MICDIFPVRWQDMLTVEEAGPLIRGIRERKKMMT